MKNNVLILSTSLMVLVSVLLIASIVKKCNHNKEIVKQQKQIDLIIQKEKRDSQMWIIDSLIYDGNYKIVAHNLNIPRLGVKFYETIKPNYSVNDTINLFNL